MLSAVLIGIIVYFVANRVFSIKVDFAKGNVDMPKMKEKPYMYSNKNYIEYITGLSPLEYGIFGNIFMWFIFALVFALIGGYSELLCADIQIGLIQSGFCAICGFCVYPFIGAVFLVVKLNEREEKKKEANNKVSKYISWTADDEDFISADCFFCNLIIDGSVAAEKLEVIKGFRNRCYKNGQLDIAEAELYLKGLNALRGVKGLEPIYSSLFEKIRSEKMMREMKAIAVCKEQEKTNKATMIAEEKFAEKIKRKMTLKVRNHCISNKLQTAELIKIIGDYRNLHPELKQYEQWDWGGYRYNDLFDFIMGYYIAQNIFSSDEIKEINESLRYREERYVEHKYEEDSDYNGAYSEDYENESYDFDNDDYDEFDTARDIRDYTFQDDYGRNGDDLYDGNGEFGDY